MAKRFLGAHTIGNGGIQMAVRRAQNAGMTALQIFTAVPKYYNDKHSVRPERVERFRAAIAESDIASEHVLAHAAYVLNVATTDETKYARASAGLTKELERSTALGVGAACFHPGAAATADRGVAAERVAQAIVHALTTIRTSSTRLLIENTAGAGRTMGKTAAEIGDVLARVPKKLRPRTGYGLDTCHLFASGHDITSSRGAFAGVLDAFEEATGEPPSFFHLNDSAGALGSNRDRHVLIGEGGIGVEPFGWLLRDRRSASVPLILETPQRHYDISGDDPAPDPYDVRMITLLRTLVP